MAKKKITAEIVRQAEQTRKDYRAARTNFDQRVIANEQYWKLMHNPPTEENKDASTSAWLFNSIINKHADFMDNFPEPVILPREESDRETAEVLNKVLPVVMAYNDYDGTYSKTTYDKIKSGTSVTGVFWDNSLMEGMGDIAIKAIDILNVDWEPGIQDIQDSKNIFITAMMDEKDVNEIYGIDIKADGTEAQIPTYIHSEDIDTSNKAAVVDWYYKKVINEPDGNGLPKLRTILHYVKYCNGEVLYASEDDPEYKNTGFYDHGRYPIVFDVLYPEKDMPVGFGNIDIMRNPQQYIDRIQDQLMINLKWNSRPRWMVRQGTGINMEDYLDMNKPLVEFEGNIDPNNVRQIDKVPIDGSIFEFINFKIEELKETSGNRDFSQGSTSSGVTAGSAIAALMEAGSKLSRDMIKQTYAAHNKICHLVIELMRQFYEEPRVFRITGANIDDMEFVSFDSSQLQPEQEEVDGILFGNRKPIFDIDCVSQKKSPFAKLSQNELAKEMYQLGFFNPELADQALACVQMMEFEGKDRVVQTISENGGMYEQLQIMQQQMAQMAQMIGMQQQMMAPQPDPTNVDDPRMGEINSLGAETNSDTRLENVREAIRNQSEVQ